MFASEELHFDNKKTIYYISRICSSAQISTAPCAPLIYFEMT